MLRRDFLGLLPLAATYTAASRVNSGAPQSKNILQYGAKPDGRTLNTQAIQRAIDEVFRSGGGTVTVPAGVFLTGRIELKSGITLNLEEGSTLLGSIAM